MASVFGTATVTSKSSPVGEAKYPIYQTVAEAQSEMGDKEMLEILNAQIRTNAMNAVRSAAQPKATKAAVRAKAYGMVTREEWNAIAGDPVKIEAKVAEKIAELERAEAAGATNDAGSEND